MIESIVEMTVTALSEAGAGPVYSAFDAVPAEHRDKGIFTVVGAGGSRFFKPIYSPAMVYVPFKADIEVKVTAPEKYSAQQLCRYFEEKTYPAALKLPELEKCLQTMKLGYDSNINRLVLTAVFSVSGINKIERRSLL